MTYKTLEFTTKCDGGHTHTHTNITFISIDRSMVAFEGHVRQRLSTSENIFKCDTVNRLLIFQNHNRLVLIESQPNYRERFQVLKK